MGTEKSGEGIRSALEIAMARLDKGSEKGPRLTEKQKAEISEVEKELQAKIAEAEIMTGQNAAAAAARGEFDEADGLRARMQDEIARYRRLGEKKKKAIRGGKG